MVDEEATFERFGYYSYDLKRKSHKKIVAVCEECEERRVLSKDKYCPRCRSCANKGKKNHNYGKHFSEETRKKIGDANKGELHPNWKGGPIMRICKECGIDFPVYPSNVKRGRGKFCSPQCYAKWTSKHWVGKNHPNWKNGTSFEPYCYKFNEDFKEYIRDKFGRVCFLCPKTEEENGQRLSVHHVNGNKNCGCDEDATCQFVPLCVSCHGKMLSKKVDWEKKIKDKMRNKLNGWYI